MRLSTWLADSLLLMAAGSVAARGESIWWSSGETIPSEVPSHRLALVDLARA
jgi:hypothetical protein